MPLSAEQASMKHNKKDTKANYNLKKLQNLRKYIVQS